MQRSFSAKLSRWQSHDLGSSDHLPGAGQEQHPSVITGWVRLFDRLLGNHLLNLLPRSYQSDTLIFLSCASFSFMVLTQRLSFAYSSGYKWCEWAQALFWQLVSNSKARGTYWEGGNPRPAKEIPIREGGLHSQRAGAVQAMTGVWGNKMEQGRVGFWKGDLVKSCLFLLWVLF